MIEKRYSKGMSIRLHRWIPVFALLIGAPFGYAQEVSFGEYTCLGPEEGRSSGVYLVRAQMVARGGAVQAFTQKLTLVK